MLNPEDLIRFIRETTPVIAGTLFQSIDPEAQYCLIPLKMAERFNYRRVMEGLPVGLVFEAGQMRPIRSLEFYRVQDTPSQDGDILEGYATMLVSSGMATMKLGEELTVDDIWKAAGVFVRAKLADLPAPENPQEGTGVLDS